MKSRSGATRTLVSMLVRFLRRREGRPSKPRQGEDKEPGLTKMSIDMFSGDERRVSIDTHTHTHTQRRVYTYTHKHTHTLTQTHIHTHTTHRHRYTHTRTHTQ